MQKHTDTRTLSVTHINASIAIIQAATDGRSALTKITPADKS